MGPGLITGAADDDPSSIATYVQAGAQFGFQLAWTILIAYPLVFVMQSISARIGRTTGRGIAGNLRLHYPPWILYSVVVPLFAVNTINISADLGAMGETMQLLVPGVPAWIYVTTFGLACTAIQVFLKYSRYINLLKLLSLSVFAYLGVLFAVNISWPTLLEAIRRPHFSTNSGYLLMFVAVLGTSISPYLFFWHGAQESEASFKSMPATREPANNRAEVARIRLDTLLGMGLACLVGLSVLVTSAATLQAPMAGENLSVSQAAQALRPIAGNFAAVIFALAIIGTGLISIPVLAGSAAYALAEAGSWSGGVSTAPTRARFFHVAIGAATLTGVVGNFAGMNSVKALIGAAVVNGLLAAPVMALLMLMSAKVAIMGDYRIAKGMRILGWFATCMMGISAAIFFYRLLL